MGRQQLPLGAEVEPPKETVTEEELQGREVGKQRLPF